MEPRQTPGAILRAFFTACASPSIAKGLPSRGGHRHAVKRLQRMHRTDRGARYSSPPFNTRRIEVRRSCAATYVPLQLFPADSRQLFRHARNRRVRRRNQNARRRQNPPRHRRQRRPRANKSNGSPRAGLVPRDNRPDLPTPARAAVGPTRVVHTRPAPTIASVSVIQTRIPRALRQIPITAFRWLSHRTATANFRWIGSISVRNISDTSRVIATAAASRDDIIRSQLVASAFQTLEATHCTPSGSSFSP